MAYPGKDAAKRDPITEDDLQRLAREFIASSLGGPDSEIAAARERNIRAYNAEPSGDFAAPEIEDRSTFVSSDVADTVDGMLPQLIDVFVSSDKAIECEPKKPGPESEEQARQATGYLNHLFYVRNDGLNVLHDWIQDAALQKVGFVKIWAEEEQEDTKQEYEGQTEEQVAAILADGAQLKGEPQVDDNGLLTFTTIDESTRWHFKVACVAPHEMRVDKNARWGDDPAAIGEVRQKRGFELIEMGYDLSEIGSGWSAHADDGEARALLGPDGDGDAEGDLHDSHRLYEYAELYFRLDVDGDGVAEWVQLCLINGTLVRTETVDDHPYAEICLMPRAHAFFGDCPADRAFRIQKEQTNLSRALFDNVYFSVNQRTYVNTRANVNIDDVLDNRPGGVVRGEGAPGDAFGPIPTIPLNQSAWQMQEWLSTKLENRTGFTRYSQGMDADSLNKTATGVSIITQKSEMRLKLMTRFAAQGIRKMFQKLLRLATRHQDGEDWFRVNGNWTPVHPMEWRDQFNISINVGLGNGTNEQKAQRVMALVPLQQMGLATGVVRPEHIANTIRLFAEVNEFKNPDTFCDEAPQGLPNPQQFAEMQEAIKKQMEDLQGQLQQAGQENEKLRHDAEAAALDAKRKEVLAAVEKGEMQLDAREEEVRQLAAGLTAEIAPQQGLAEQVAVIGDQVQQLADVVVQILNAQQFQQPPPPMEGMGMDAGMEAPAAPIEGSPPL